MKDGGKNDLTLGLDTRGQKSTAYSNSKVYVLMAGLIDSFDHSVVGWLVFAGLIE